MSDPIVEVHYISQKSGAANLVSSNSGGNAAESYVMNEVPNFVPSRHRPFFLPNNPTHKVIEANPASGFTRNGPFDRYVYESNGAYTHLPYDVHSLKPGFKGYYDNIADTRGIYQFFCLYNNFNRCNNLFRCCKEGISYPVYCWIIFFILFLAMLFVFIMLGLAGTKYNGRYIIG